nr:hypothetical protein [Tanacetum cinerariifolium]
MQKKFHVAVSKTKAFRAKAKAQVHLKGDVTMQYSLLRNYVSELQICNPDTTVKTDVYREEDPEKTTRMFRRIYVCLGSLKRGFKEGGRELLGLDMAFMRGKYPGQKIRVVGVDVNNGIYPVTWDCGIRESILLDMGQLLKIARLFPSAKHRIYERIPHEEDCDGSESYSKCDGPLTPLVTKLFNKIKQALTECTVDWNGSDLFQGKGPYQDQQLNGYEDT